ncbi:hypothetical protein HID58_093326 [Brassica napus]|uniref:Uncharacterized protein n=1 Tax=Brassica napus TaxID=3708 RepID=A0ABQ7XBG3_BRANA|nr:hypothetical protein HID58_092056 [Brassica napus]KAH0853298.1 hypothetical protein HID58_093326 [Brassica napus]
MARRFTSEEKGKAITQNSTGPPRLRMRAPEFDPTDLIKENMLKLNNPQKARTQMDHRNNEVTSPPYTRRRTTYHTDRHREGNIAERKDNSPVLQWRARSPVVAQEVTPPSSPFQPPRRSVGRNLESRDFPPAIELPSREEVLEELRETTLQYICCPDPMESAARKQRVLQSEMNRGVEEAATRILQASAALARTETLQVSELLVSYKLQLLWRELRHYKYQTFKSIAIRRTCKLKPHLCQ